ncbi:MAG TPA: YggS family pyridoxal phosphate-dependent enzyme [Ottowia sp.]|nr:YggS family pyridoxal phosphate-dependent enzyme [Ottowia sp.]
MSDPIEPADSRRTRPKVDLHGHYPQARSVAEFRERLAIVQARIAAACARAGRDPADVRLLPVSKTIDEAHIRMAHAAGCRALGENKPQELATKAEAMADLADLRWCAIGHLQTNKARLVARFAHEFHALDRLRVAETLERRLQAEGRALDVYVQVNTSGEASKWGLPPEEAAPFLRALAAYPALRVRGLMTLAMFSADADRVRACFAGLRTLRDRLRQDAPAGARLDGLSMGMSGDYEIAIEEGATVVRVGQAIFGSRALPDSHYWPGMGG